MNDPGCTIKGYLMIPPARDTESRPEQVEVELELLKQPRCSWIRGWESIVFDNYDIAKHGIRLLWDNVLNWLHDPRSIAQTSWAVNSFVESHDSRRQVPAVQPRVWSVFGESPQWLRGMQFCGLSLVRLDSDGFCVGNLQLDLRLSMAFP
jgi:hypothetical protein